MFGKALKGLKAVAPILGATLAGTMGGGPAGAIAARKLIANALSVDENADFEDALKNATPEQLVELQRIDAELAARKREADIESERIAADDRQKARLAAQASDSPSAQIGFGAAVFVFLGACLYGLFMIEDIPDAVEPLLFGIIGALVRDAGSIISYYYGSSSSSAAQNASSSAVAEGARKR